MDWLVETCRAYPQPALGCGTPYAVGDTLLTIFGLVIVLLMSASGGAP